MESLMIGLAILTVITLSYIYIVITIGVLNKRSQVQQKIQALLLKEIREIKLALLDDETVPKAKISDTVEVTVECTKKAVVPISTVKETVIPVQPAVVEQVLKPAPVINQTQKKSPTTPKAPGKVKQVFIDIKDWLLVGDKYRSEGVSKEYAIASNWLARLGIMILVLGIAFALRYSYVHGLVSHQIRVIASLITGILMAVFGLKQDGKKYELLGHGLLGGGITTLYFSVFSATNLYHLISPTLGIGCMVLVTITCGILSVKFNSKLVAILGILGGYLTPVLLSTGSHNIGALYCYMLLIGLGVLGITIHRNWYLIRGLGFTCHWVIAIGALVKTEISGTYYSFGLIISLLTIFFLLFSFNACFYQLRKNIHSTILEIVGLFLNSAVFTVIATTLIVNHFNNDYRYGAFVMIGLAIFYIICSNVILRRKNSDRGLVLTFLAFSGFFTAMALPFLLSAGWLTVSWSLQALITLWLSRKLNNRFLQGVSYVVYVITFISLISTFQNLYHTNSGAFNVADLKSLLLSSLSHLIQIGIPVFSFLLAKKMLVAEIKSSPLATEAINDIPDKLVLNKNTVGLILQSVFVVFIFTLSMTEVFRIFDHIYPAMLIPATNLVVILLASYLLFQVKKTTSPIASTLLNLVIAILVLKVLFVDSFFGWNLSAHFIYGPTYSVQDGIMRLLNFGMLTVVLVNLINLPTLKKSALNFIAHFFSFVTLFVPFIFLTLEIKSIMHVRVPAFEIGVVSLVWALYAITMLAFGIIKSKPMLRYLALALFALTTLKVFTIDLENLGEFWRIVAFLCLGIIIFFGSFIYIRYQHLFSINPEDSHREN